uniref:Uncharacterized protein n=1 Tax=Arundo donax TaxID=35708 RepID=A0A0A8YQG5_ARUDO
MMYINMMYFVGVYAGFKLKVQFLMLRHPVTYVH